MRLQWNQKHPDDAGEHGEWYSYDVHWGWVDDTEWRCHDVPRRCSTVFYNTMQGCLFK
jgi:hypothetical protein